MWAFCATQKAQNWCGIFVSEATYMNSDTKQNLLERQSSCDQQEYKNFMSNSWIEQNVMFVNYIEICSRM